MRSLFALLALSVLPGCPLQYEDDPPPIARPCGPSEEAQTLKDGPYGSGVEKLADVDVYPSFKSDYPKRLVVSRTAARIEYVHETKAVVESWTLGPLSSPVEGQCNMTGHERGTLTLAGVTVDGVAGDASRYVDWTVTLMAGASVSYRHADGRQLTTVYRHGFSPIFTTPCPFRRPADGTACNETAICAYDLEGERCTTRCGGGKWQSFSCAM